jgi:hypothetical protein
MWDAWVRREMNTEFRLGERKGRGPSRDMDDNIKIGLK